MKNNLLFLLKCFIIYMMVNNEDKMYPVSIRLSKRRITQIDEIVAMDKRNKTQVIQMIIEHYFESNLDIFDLNQKRESGSNQKDQDIPQADKKT